MGLCSEIGHWWVTSFTRERVVRTCSQCKQRVVVEERDDD